MGGLTAVTFREKDGTITNLTVYKSDVPDLVNQDDFHENAESQVSFFIGLRKPDQESDTLAPTSYGLIVVDLISNTILTHQDYDDIVTKKPFTVIDFKNHGNIKEEYENFKIKLKELNFILTKEDLEIWEEYVADD